MFQTQHASATDAAMASHGLSDPLAIIVNTESWLPLTENWIHTQVAHLPRSVMPYVVCGSTRNREQFPVDHLHSFAEMSRFQRAELLARSAPRLGITLARRSALIAMIARRHDARLVHSHFGHTGYYSCKAIRRLGLAHVVTFYGVDMSALPQMDDRWYERYRALFRHVDAVLCEGPHMADQVGRLGCPRDKLQVHHLGVGLSTLPFRPRRWRPGETLRILICASFREKKGIPSAIDALAELARDLPLEVSVIGDARENPKSLREKVRIVDAITRSGLGDRVRLLGYQPHEAVIREAYQHHLFLSPSVTASDGDSEGGAPVVLIEMAATGMPIVSTRHADIPEIIKHGVTGLLADEHDVGGLVAQLRWLVQHPDQWDGLLDAGRAHIEREFNAEIQGKRQADIYQALTA